jgi:hypothetical protein
MVFSTGLQDRIAKKMKNQCVFREVRPLQVLSKKLKKKTVFQYLPDSILSATHFPRQQTK